MNGFQIKWEEDENWIHSDSYKIYMKKKKVPETPSITVNSIKIPGSNRTLKQSIEYGPRNIEIECQLVTDNRAETKRLLMDLVYKLSQEVVLRFDDKLDLIYYAQLNEQLIPDEIMDIGVFTLNLICLDGFRYSIDLAKELTLDSDMTLSNDIYLATYNTEFENIIDTTNITLNNAGTYEAQPLIELQGTCDLINISCHGVTTSYGPINADEIIRIDCKEYEITKEINGDITNALLNWQGDFLCLEPGLNTVQITGTNLNIINLKFDYRHTFL